MRHLFIAFLIALLPLRGWVSDAMATGMVISQVQAQQQGAIKKVAEEAGDKSAKAHFDADFNVKQPVEAMADCADHAAGSEAHTGVAHCESCSACQACHTVALTPAPVGVSFAFNLGMLPRAVAAQFASAPAARGQKPPIS